MIGAQAGVIAINGKTVRHMYQENGKKASIHMASAFAERPCLVLGQTKVAEKSNEFVAIPKLLEMLTIEGAIVTIEAMRCQRAIARKILDKKADYVLALKDKPRPLISAPHGRSIVSSRPMTTGSSWTKTATSKRSSQ
jgi:hypothetical protein